MHNHWIIYMSDYSNQFGMCTNLGLRNSNLEFSRQSYVIWFQVCTSILWNRIIVVWQPYHMAMWGYVAIRIPLKCMKGCMGCQTNDKYGWKCWLWAHHFPSFLGIELLTSEAQEKIRADHSFFHGLLLTKLKWLTFCVLSVFWVY